MNYIHSVALIAVVALVTIALRFLPFAVFNGKRKTPEIVTYLGRVLPFAIMGMLVIYCYKGISFLSSPFGIPELIAGAGVVVLHLIKRNTLLSIVGGTVIYMLLIQLVFV
ncbi:MAG: branched-chain amino acid transporter AzlD [Ruminococcaceae bacterium]|nr:branched-chain amino acid transporter AzlD [Oscillospiraceae bacterium]